MSEQNTEIDGKRYMVVFPKEQFSYFCKFDQLQGIVGNPKGIRIAKKDSCYRPASRLIKPVAKGSN